MHILHITPYYAPAWTFGGVVRAVHGLAVAQVAQGDRVTVITTDALDRTRRLSDSNGTNRTNETVDGVEIIRLKNWSAALRGRFNLSTPTAFRTEVRDILAGGVQVIHLHEIRTSEALLVPSARPIVVSPHGTLAQHSGRSGFKRIWDVVLGSRIARKIGRVSALTLAEAQEAEKYWQLLGVPFPGAIVIPNGVPDGFSAQVRSANGIALRERYTLGLGEVILYIGRLSERKGVHLLIAAFAQIVSSFPQARLLIVGADEGMLTDLQALAHASGIADRVVFTGHLEGADRLAAYAASDIFVLPAEGEGQSIAAIEAMAARLPLLLTPGCHMPELDQRGAGVTAARETEALAAALHTLLADADLRKQMGEHGLAWVQESFVWSKIARATDDLYRHVVNK